MKVTKTFIVIFSLISVSSQTTLFGFNCPNPQVKCDNGITYKNVEGVDGCCSQASILFGACAFCKPDTTNSLGVQASTQTKLDNFCKYQGASKCTFATCPAWGTIDKKNWQGTAGKDW